MLTDTEIKKAKPLANDYRLSDSGGLFLWVTKAGGKLWRWAYRYEGKEKLMSFGKYPDITLAQARDLHRAARKRLASGLDPMAERKAEKIALKVETQNTFQNIAALWFEHWQADKSPRHVDYVKRRMAQDVFPAIGMRPIAAIEAPELVALVKTIEQRGASDIAKRALETVGMIFRYAVAHGYAARNPASDIKPRDILRATVKTNYARIVAKDLPDLLRSIEVYHGAPVTRLAMKLMALTFVRTSELIGARWDEFDLKNTRWDIPATRMKMRTPHIVPLAKQTVTLLHQIHALSGAGELLFPSDIKPNNPNKLAQPAKPMSNNTILKALERMGYKGRMTGHGFRGLASTVLHEQGHNHEHIELQLAHAPRNAVSAAYNHALYLEPRAQMMQHWADYLDQAQTAGQLLSFKTTKAA